MWVKPASIDVPPDLRLNSRFVDSAQMLMLRPFCSSPLTAFRLRRISSGSCRGVQELRRRDLLYAVGGMSGSAAKTLKYNIFHIYFSGNFFFFSSYKGIRLKLSKSTKLYCVPTTYVLKYYFKRLKTQHNIHRHTKS